MRRNNPSLDHYSRNFLYPSASPQRLEEWVTCFRAQTPICLWKHFIVCSKWCTSNTSKIERVDVLLTTLCKTARDKKIKRLTKVEKGKPTHCICLISKRHKSAIDIHGKKYKNVYNNWDRSEMEGKHHY